MYQAVTYISGQKTDQHVIHFRDEILHLQQDDNTESLKNISFKWTFTCVT